MLYQWEVGRTSMSEVLRRSGCIDESEEAGLSDEHRAFAVRLATGVADTVGDIDPVIVESAEHWRIERMNVHGPADPAAGRLRVPSRARHAGAGHHQRGAGAGPHLQRRRLGAVHQRHSRRDSPPPRTRMTTTDESDQVVQRRANLEELRKLGVAPTRTASMRDATIDDDRARARQQDGRGARRRADHDPHGRPHPGDSQLRQGELSGAVRRQVAHSGLHPAGRAVRSAISRSSSCSTSATGSASKGGCSAPRRRNSRSGRRSWSSSRSACCRCRKSGTASPTSRPATGSAIST